jgi:hypothetical protein
MLIKTGGGGPAAGLVAGIHSHMYNANEISYIASDDQRQKIEYVRMRNRKTGQVEEYWARHSKFKPEQLKTMAARTMDCIDCHNRPTHIYVPPDRSIDRALLGGRIDRTLPYVKQRCKRCRPTTRRSSRRSPRLRTSSPRPTSRR